MEDAAFGKYDSVCEVVDQLLLNFPHLVSVAAVGNDRNDGSDTQPTDHWIEVLNENTTKLEWVPSQVVSERDGFKDGGLDTVSGLAVCKNVLAVGAIVDLFQDGKRILGASLSTTVFSSWGPTDDGRIKPDVVANGQQLLSPTIPPESGSSTPDELYEEMSGTSMASPTAAGIAILMIDYFAKRYKRQPFSPEIRALLSHSATDAGSPGPDPEFGYGS